MKKVVSLIAAVIIACSTAFAQRTTFTGNVIIYGSGFNTRTVTAPFTLRINSTTSPQEAQRLLGRLQEGGQRGLLDALNGTRGVGTLSIGNRVGHELGAIVVDRVGDKQRIRAITDRWIGFGELWRGSRSTDYPFTYIELIVDPRTGRGDGTFIAAAQVRWRGNQNQVEIEDFGTYPGRVVNVRMTGARL